MERNMWAPLWAAPLLAVAGFAGGNGAQAAELTATESLGKLIFFDTQLSINRNQSCATCHAPGAGWTGPDQAINAAGTVYAGSIHDRFGERKPPSSAYSTQSPVLRNQQKNPRKEAVFVGGHFWDGRATGERLGSAAAEQAQGPFLNPVEQALPSAACVVHRVCTGAYWALARAVFGADACSVGWAADPCAPQAAGRRLSPADDARVGKTYDAIARAIAAYEASSESDTFTSKFDYVARGRAKFTAEEQRGLQLFRGKGKCANCHVLESTGGRAALFTDFTYDNLGLPRNPANPAYAADPAFVDQGLGGFLAGRADYARHAEAAMGKHKVPTLRNVDLRPDPGFVKAYGHNGYFKSLKGIVHFYATRDAKPACPLRPDGRGYSEAQALAAGCWPPPEVARNVNRSELGDLRLTAAEEDAIVAFMKTLSDGYGP
jgi:cytochrome c peroxidase